MQRLGMTGVDSVATGAKTGVRASHIYIGILKQIVESLEQTTRIDAGRVESRRG